MRNCATIALGALPLFGGLVIVGGADIASGQCPIPPDSINETAKLTAADADARAEFEKSTSMIGNVAVIGAPLQVGGSGVSKVYVYRFDGWRWTEEAILTPSDGPGKAFGFAASVCGDVAVIGAPSSRLEAAGKAYIYRFDGIAWTAEARLFASDGQDLDRFGNAASIRDDVAVVGAFNEGNIGEPWAGTGAAYVYRFDPDTSAWVEEIKLVSPDPLPDQFDQFGPSVSLGSDPGVVVIGTEPLSFGAPIPVGSAYVFRYDPDACEGPGCSPWIDEAKLIGSDSGGADRFGYSVSISGDVIVAGAWGEFGGECPFPQICHAGAAYVFHFDPDACDGGGCSPWIEQAKVTSSDVEDGDLLGWAVALSDGAALIGAWGDGDAGIDSGSVYVFGGVGDCNENDTLDLCDIADGTSKDKNDNGVPDECEASIPGDFDDDVDVDVFDLRGSWNARLAPEEASCRAGMCSTSTTTRTWT